MHFSYKAWALWISNETTKLVLLDLSQNTIKNRSDKGNDNVVTLTKIYNSNLTLNLADNLFYEGQADDIVNLYGNNLTITYIKENL